MTERRFPPPKAWKPANELYIMVQELILAIKESQNSIQEKFSEAGRKAKLLLIKGGLIIK